MSETQTIEALLADGTAPATEADCLARLAGLGVEQRTFHHEAVYTVAESKALRGDLGGSHIKNLFLRNKKGGMWLVTCQEDRQIDLKALGAHIGAGRLSFASAERMMKYLGVRPGAVTPLAVMNDTGGKVTMVLDRAVLGEPTVNVHPLHNAATTVVTPDGLLTFLEAMDHAPAIVDLDDYAAGS